MLGIQGQDVAPTILPECTQPASKAPGGMKAGRSARKAHGTNVSYLRQD